MLTGSPLFRSMPGEAITRPIWTESTGLESWPAVVDVHVDGNVQPHIDSDEGFRHRLEEVAMKPSGSY